MSVTWRSTEPPPVVRRSPGHAPRALLRGGALIAVIFAGVLATLPLRAVERPLYGVGRPWSPRITQWVCRGGFRILGLRHRTQGTPMTGPGAVVSNHVSWLDIFALNARSRVYFVAKSEVARWPGIGALARLVGTVFITRDARDARAQTALFAKRLGAGHRLLFFPEGSSTDGMRVLSFKSTLFQAFFDVPGVQAMQVQPVTVVYRAPDDQDPRFYGWWGDMSFGAHVWQVLGASRQGEVRVVYHAPLDVAEFGDRKTLAVAACQRVRAGMPEAPRQGG
ncbi:lysophospholipid acyltransferase family protein [Roseovarius sp. D22-M7]|uniref:lysophospholipid acyltransferase family protein n=1 Tax=Roseovarius sp. D22-M7 TaxID=3127116 RepID=UPI00301017CF